MPLIRRVSIRTSTVHQAERRTKADSRHSESSIARPPADRDRQGTRGSDPADRVYNVRSGIASALVSMPMRYMHSMIEMIELSDVERCILLLTNFIR
jgi:hypothetical protein